MTDQKIILEAEKREVGTDKTLKLLRQKGRIPAIVYGGSDPAVAVSIDEKSLQSAIHSERGRNALITLKVADGSQAVLVKEMQRNPITRAIVHVDFQRVSLKEKIETSVPVHIKGEAPGVKLGGGVLEYVVREAKVRCYPAEIPASIDADVSNLQINASIKAKDLPVPQGVELLLDPESIIVTIVAPTILEEAPAPGAAEAAAGAAAAEPEVIKKGKVEEGEEGAAAPAAGAKAPAGGEKKPAAAPAAKPETKK
jgi:large subunit ribosomal protein L25